MLRDRFAPAITKALTPASINSMKKGIGAFVDKNSQILLTMNMADRYSFGDKERNVLYTAMNISDGVLAAAVEEAKDIPSVNKIQSNTFYCSAMLLMHCFLKLKKEKEARLVMLYISMQMYTSMHSGFFKYKANPKIMNYTLAHLDNSFKIRQFPSLYAWLDDNAQTTFDAYKDRLMKLNDEDIRWVNAALWDRLKGKMRKIANAYYENWKSGNYLNEDDDTIDAEGNQHQVDNNSYVIERLSTQVYLKLLKHQFDQRFFKYAVTRTDVSMQKFKNMTMDIIDGDSDQKLKEYISSCIEHFIMQSGMGFDFIGRGEYISYMQMAYASNTEAGRMRHIKEVLDIWLDENASTLGKSNYGKTARLGYKKALFMFFNFIINYEAKAH